MCAKWPLTYKITLKSYRNKLTKIIKVAKENYYNSELTDYAGNTKKTWNIISSLLGKSKPKLPSSFFFNGVTVTSYHDVLKHFNDYFSSVGITLANNIQETQHPFNSHLSEPVSFSLYLTPTSLEEIKSIIQNISHLSWP